MSFSHRKETETQPPTRKMGKAREAQRKLQEKQRLFVESLQKQVSELAASVSHKAQEVLELKQQMAVIQVELGQWRSLGVSFPERGELLRLSPTIEECARCQAAKQRAEFYERQIKALEARFANVQEELESIHRSALNSALVPFIPEPVFVSNKVIPDFHAFMSTASIPCLADMSDLLPLQEPDLSSFDYS
ncbi:hypothetical protein BC830DRAFT_897093 [Chytriomyces sp. MP71]|nr:hypothetical protein BC830DRAFT_897093 [Chytriomyces sp. MP71]